ncbi:hypothetical protein [Kitasatospora sp. HPMI-4]|uniref:hypothetical protein n=1 Tax=Kitasatospora sp. HPMI-4 TaxID=3448443 RepID=UPI003F1A44EA
MTQPSGDEYRGAAKASTEGAHMLHDKGESAHTAIQGANLANTKAAEADRKG